MTRTTNHNTIDLFTSAPLDEHRGDGLPASADVDADSQETPLPSLDDIELHRTEPFRVPGLKSLVLPLPVFSLKLVRERTHLTRQITTPREAARICCEILEDSDREIFLVLAMSTSGRIVGAHVAHVGTIDASIASPREVFKFSLSVNARSFLIAHNHPSGNLEPSRADVEISKQLKAAGELMGIPLRDSLVCGFDGQYTSLAERGLL